MQKKAINKGKLTVNTNFTALQKWGNFSGKIMKKMRYRISEK